MQSATLTLCLAVASGVLLVIAAQRTRIPSIVLLLFGGVLLGPEVLGWIDPSTLSHGLETVVALAVAVILFEGGLSLDLQEYRKTPVVIRRLLTWGALITWLGTAFAVVLLYDFSPGMALMAGSLVIVTGPTVVSPMLRRLNVKERLHHVLYWEAVLIDVIGVFIAVLCYEWLTPDPSHPFILPIARLGMRIFVGIGLGIASGYVVALVLRKSWIAVEYENIFVLACALLTFGIAHLLLSESGILAVVVAGLVVGLKHSHQLKHIKRFKLQLTDLGIGTLFILLAARLDLNQFAGLKLFALLVIVVLVIRPIVVWLATLNQGFHLKEKLFLSWIAPRGIVAATMASLFAIRLEDLGNPNAAYLETFTYAIIAVTVTIQGMSAPWVIRLLGLQRADRRTWVLLGNNILSKHIGRALRHGGTKVIEMDPDNMEANTEWEDPRLADTQAVLCTDITMLQNVWNTYMWGRKLREDDCFRWATFEPQRTGSANSSHLIGHAVWNSTVSALAVAEGLMSGSYSIDLVEVGKGEENGRFGKQFQPLFWIDDGHAHIVKDPLEPGLPRGDLAVVLRSPVIGLAELICHVNVFEESQPQIEKVLQKLATSANRLFPEMPTETIIEGILFRGRTMPMAVGSGIAIPHAYSNGVKKSCCFLGVVTEGIADLTTPDNKPVRLVFLLLSPLGRAQEHLSSLAAIGSLGQEPKFIELLTRQRIPGRIAALLKERA